MQDRLKIYRLVPIARAKDPNWQNATSHGEVIVRAKTAGDARIVACQAELDFMEIDAAPWEGTSTDMASAFRSDKLYSVIEDNSGRFVPNGPREVIGGRVRVDNLISTQL
ncbi:hypothetical protein KX729_10660 [Rhizobium sp. XQZ8]|jgi:hypothetical protein|uniref:hypothetical protein n=1 Tax=Rhizobium populisoli TaxID=2859785 RepID=UPI001CA48BD3|nr:hypothetical protein [Rhizobium populisoli]MBW6421905.1 hypothetical protein [Rhizobium populisoli]